MGRHAVGLLVAVVMAVVMALGVAALAGKPPKAGKPARRAPSLSVQSIDLGRRQVRVEVSGVAKAPPANYFAFTDERGRHFVAMAARCQEPLPSGARACELEIPLGYEKHRMVSLLLHLRGLHGSTVQASEAQVAAAWDAALTQADSPASPDGGAPPDGGPRPDGGVPRPAAK